MGHSYELGGGEILGAATEHASTCGKNQQCGKGGGGFG